MAIGTPVLEVSNGSGTDATSYTISSFTPTASRVLTLFISNGAAATAATPTSLTGTLGLTWTQVITGDNVSNNMRGTLYTAVTTASPPTGTIVINFGATQSSCQYMIHSWSGANTTTPVVQSDTLQSGNPDNPAITLSTLASGSATVGYIVRNGTGSMSAGSGMTLLTDSVTATSPAISSGMEYDISSPSTSVGWTTTLNIEKILFAAEIAVAATAHTGDAAVTATTTVAGTGVLGRSTAGNVTATATLAATGARGAVSSAAVAPSVAVAADGTVAKSGSATQAATVAIAAAGSVGSTRTADQTATATIAADGTRAATGSAAVTATTTLAADGTRAASTTAPLAVGVALAADGDVATTASGVATVEADATLTADGTIAKSGDTAQGVTGTIAATGVRGGTSPADQTLAVTITADGTVTRTAASDQGVTTTVTAAGTRGANQAADAALAVTLAADGNVVAAVDLRDITLTGTLLRSWSGALQRTHDAELAEPTRRGALTRDHDGQLTRPWKGTLTP